MEATAADWGSKSKWFKIFQNQHQQVISRWHICQPRFTESSRSSFGDHFISESGSCDHAFFELGLIRHDRFSSMHWNFEKQLQKNRTQCIEGRQQPMVLVKTKQAFKKKAKSVTCLFTEWDDFTCKCFLSSRRLAVETQTSCCRPSCFFHLKLLHWQARSHLSPPPALLTAVPPIPSYLQKWLSRFCLCNLALQPAATSIVHPGDRLRGSRVLRDDLCGQTGDKRVSLGKTRQKHHGQHVHMHFVSLLQPSGTPHQIYPNIIENRQRERERWSPMCWYSQAHILPTSWFKTSNQHNEYHWTSRHELFACRESPGPKASVSCHLLTLFWWAFSWT